LRKTFLAMGEDVRVVLIKLADRLHNMRTLGHMPEHKRKRIAQETLDIFAPLANRLGIWQIKWELEDLGFRHVNPEKYKEIAELLTEKRPDREVQLRDQGKSCQTSRKEQHQERDQWTTQAHLFDLQKDAEEGIALQHAAYDVRAVRLIVPDVPSCYAALGVIHTTGVPSPANSMITSPRPRTISTNPCIRQWCTMTNVRSKCRSARRKCT
jgi:(p)ppGpp synthase/HD superfamily hydrolase